MKPSKKKKQTKTMEKFKAVIRLLIIALPYVVYVLRILLTLIDVSLQDGAHRVMKILKVLPNQKTDNNLKKPIL